MFNRKRKLMMTGIASLVIMAVLGFFSFQHVSDQSETPPVVTTSVMAQENVTIYSGLTQNLAGDEAEVIIAAPAEVKLGKLVVLDVSQSVGNKFEWMVVPETEDFLVIDEGRRAVFSSGVPGEFMFIVACAVNDSVNVKRHVVRVIGSTPPPPTPDPEPPVPPGPATTLSKKIGTWCTGIQSPSRSNDAVKLAGAFESIAAQIDAGTLTQPYDIITATTEANRAALGEQLQAWIPFLRSLQAELEQRANNGLLVTQSQHSAVWKEVAKGLRYFATSKQ